MSITLLLLLVDEGGLGSVVNALLQHRVGRWFESLRILFFPLTDARNQRVLGLLQRPRKKSITHPLLPFPEGPIMTIEQRRALWNTTLLLKRKKVKKFIIIFAYINNDLCRSLSEIRRIHTLFANIIKKN